MDAEKSPKNPKYFCDYCELKTNNKKDYSKHIMTAKHKIMSEGCNKDAKISHQHNCECGSSYKYRQGLTKHKLVCSISESDKLENTMDMDDTFDVSTVLNVDMIMEVLKQNQEFKEMLIEQNTQNMELHKQLLEFAAKPGTNNTTTNNQFNLQFFLNETCKDALNIMDFVNSLHLQVKDFEATGRLGFVEGISRIIVNGLRGVDVSKRPVHCTDVKREILYIKDDNLWEKENPEKSKLKRAVNIIAKKNFNQLSKWREENPEYLNINTKASEELLQLSIAALGGRNPEEDAKFMDKIMKNVLREIVIDKR